MDELLVVASNMDQEKNEIRTHCLNILRFMFVNAKLGDFVPAYVGNAVITALLGFKSPSWKVSSSNNVKCQTGKYNVM